jgi:hypothetical protein
MKVLCKKIISAITKEELTEQNPLWIPRLIKGNEYTVLALSYCEGSGLQIYIQTEDNGEPGFFDLDGFEFLNQKIPMSWVTVFSESYGRKVMTILPSSWNYESFFEDIENEDPKAVELFNKEVEQIYREELSVK